MCILCKTQSVYEFTNKRTLCKMCFIKWFQKKFLYINRKFKLIRPGDNIGYENKGDFRGAVLENLLRMFEGKFMIELIKLPSKKKINKKAVSSNVDSEADKIIHTLIKGKTKDLKKSAPIKGKTIKPLYLFTNEEILIYAKLKKLKFKKTSEKKDKVSTFVNTLEKKHPEVKRAIVKSYLKMSK